MKDDNNIFEVDWSKIGNYRKGSPEDTIGFSLFMLISEMKKTLEITPAFFPQSEEHNYEWDWVIDDNNKLALSLVSDEIEVLRLTDSSHIDDSLPFKIYICIPQYNLQLKRKTESILNPNGKTLINGKIEIANYNDINLLETTNLEEAKSYIKNRLEKDLIKFKNGELKPKDVSETKWLKSNELNEFDLKKLQSVMNMKSFEIVNDDTADKFLDDLDDESE